MITIKKTNKQNKQTTTTNYISRHKKLLYATRVKFLKRLRFDSSYSDTPPIAFHQCQTIDVT